MNDVREPVRPHPVQDLGTVDSGLLRLPWPHIALTLQHYLSPQECAILNRNGPEQAPEKRSETLTYVRGSTYRAVTARERPARQGGTAHYMLGMRHP